MAKPYSTAIDTTLDAIEPFCGSAGKEAPEIFDDRGRTVPWMTRTLNRLYDVQAQRILDREKVVHRALVLPAGAGSTRRTESTGTEQARWDRLDNRCARFGQQWKSAA